MRRGRPWATGWVSLAAITVQLWPGDARGLEFNSRLIEDGQLWRLWSGHLVHFSAPQLGWSLAMLVPIGAWAERAAPRRLRVFYVVAPALIGLALIVFDPQGARYGGLSAIAAGAMALLAFTFLGRTAGSVRWIWSGVLAFLIMKIGLELLLQESVFAVLGAPGLQPVPLAAMAGVACAAVVHGTRRRFHM